MLAKMVNNIARFFYKNGIIKEEDIEIYAYGLEILFSSLFSIAAILIVSVFARQFLGTLAFFAAFIPLRTYAGGYHAKDHLRCFITLAIVYAIDLLIIFYAPEYIKLALLVFTVFYSVALVLLFSPVDNENKPLSEDEKAKYRRTSITVLSIEIIVSAAMFAAGGITPLLTHFINGQLAASSSLMTAKINNNIHIKRKEDSNEKNNAGYN